MFCYSIYMKRIDYTYQIKAANQVLADALSNRYKASVLAVAPGGGKTTVSHHIINNHVAQYPNARILVLTEGQRTLKNQYISELESPNVSINFTFGGFNSDAQVRIGIPQSIDQLDWTEIDLLIVDEAHNFYLEPMVQNIVANLNPKHKVLMTGSPTKYNALNDTRKKYAIYYISAEELQSMGVYSAVDVDIARAKTKDPVDAYKAVVIKATANGDSLDKIMIACSTIKDATKLSIYLINSGRKVSLSTSKNDPDDVQIAEFKQNKTDTLIVVGKGVLGFNDSYITTLIDMRSSSNLDASFQLFARVLRRHPHGIKKAYYRVSLDNSKSYNKQVLIGHKMLALMERGIYTRYSGKNLRLEMIA